MTTVFSVGVSADGKNVYSVSNDGIAAFSRSASGSLSEIGCVTEPPVDTGDSLSFLASTCVTGVALEEATELAISPDGRFVYVGGGPAIAVFARSSSGALTQLAGTAGCLSDDGSDGACTAVPLLDDSQAMTFSPDGRQLYVLSVAGDRVMTFNHDPASGGLSLAGCISNDGSGGQCATGRALDNPQAMAVSADGASVYVVTNLSSAVTAFARSSSGALSQLPGALGCVSDDGSGGACLTGDSLVSPTGVAVSPDGRNVYVVTSQGNPVVGYDSIDVFSRVTPAPPPVKVTIRKTGTGAAKVLVTSTPAGIRCGSRCSANFAAGTTVTLKAKAPAGYQIQWGGPCKGSAPICRFQAKASAVTLKSRPPAPSKKHK